MTDTVFDRFRAMHRRPRGFLIPNPWDALSARQLEAFGAEALATSSVAAAFTLGVEDGEVTRDQMIAHVGVIARAVSIPVSADLTDGFGETPEAVAETIRMAAAAGAAGGSIEDVSGADVAGAAAPFALLPLDLCVARVRAAVEAARSLGRPFVFTARSDGHLRGLCSVEEAIGRAAAYAEAGAEAIFVPGLSSLEEVRALKAAVDRPINVLAPYGGLTCAAAILDLGVARISNGSSLFRAALAHGEGAMKTVLAGDFSPILTARSYYDYQAMMRGG
jgi:2-methylisocitrate lyase-like PEP mutase family enzyme